MNLDTPLLMNKNNQIIKNSVVSYDQISYGLSRTANELRLLIQSHREDVRLKVFEGERSVEGENILISAPLSSHNAEVLRNQLPWLKPTLIGLKTSAGMGDRLGLATPGHVRAIRNMNGQITPIFAQQSIRENTRTGRTPQQVIDDATWGVFQEGWRDGYGADADHLKTTRDIDDCVKAGYTFFTIDPGEFVDNRAESADIEILRVIANDLPIELDIRKTDLLNKTIHVEQLQVYFDESSLLKAMVKYGKAIWHVHNMYEHLKKAAGTGSFELEVSVDETENPTSHLEHIYIASELKRLDVHWVSLAPRFVGQFEKGVDYIGNLSDFERDIQGHAAIARSYGPYKISLHSGSDKFSIYAIAAKATKGLVHLKTAGTSYLEALRTIATIDPEFFTEIYTFCKDRYEIDKVSYHVSAHVDQAPDTSKISNVSEILDQFDAREILHVTFGSVLKEKVENGSYRFFERFMQVLRNHPEEYAQNLEKHFLRHLKPFIHEKF